MEIFNKRLIENHYSTEKHYLNKQNFQTLSRITWWVSLNNTNK